MKLERGGLILGLIIGLLAGLAVALAVTLYVTKAPVPFVNKVPPRTADQDAAEAERNKNWDPNAGLSSRTPPPKPIEGSASAADPGAAARPPAQTIPSAGSRDPAAILSGAPVDGADGGAKAPARPAGPVATPVPASPPPAAATPAKPTAPPAAAASKPGSAAATAAATAAAAAKPSSRAAADPFTYFVQAGAFQSSNEAEQQRAKLAILGVETKIIEREQSGRTVFRVRAGPYARQPEADSVKEKLIGSGVEAMLVRVERQAGGAP